MADEGIVLRRLAAGLVLVALACAAPGQKQEVVMVRQPAVAGQFYPAGKQELTAMVDAMLASAEQSDAAAAGGRAIGIQVPHAGYPYSGPTAARAFRLLRGMDSVTVVILGTSHHVMIEKAAVYAKGTWRTPLGDVPIDDALARDITSRGSYLAEMPEAHAAEHSIEVQLPFLQRVLGSFKIVPIMLLQPTFEQCAEVGQAIAAACKGKRVVLVASSDLYHGDSYAEDKATDRVTVGAMLTFDPESLYSKLDSGKAQACGGYPIVAMEIAARELGASRAVLLGQTNSNDVMHERGGYCVGYSAVAFVAEGQGLKAEGEGSDDLTEAEQLSLLNIARQTLENHVRGKKVPEPQASTARLAEPRGVFVTLHEKGELRGCIGYVEAYKPLYQAVRDMAIAASTEDPRFSPVQPEELPDIDIEITALSPLRPLASPESVVVGRHGLVIRKGRNSGLLLPQVPVEQGWNREQFLANTCLKAGLPTGAYKEKDAQLFTFTGQVFRDKKR
jgi:MEMO1 family protein